MRDKTGHIAQEEFIKLLEKQGHRVIRPSRCAEDAERRIAACLHACKGITTKALESGTLNNFDLQRDRMVLTQQRDELLAALEGLVQINEEHNASVADVIGKPLNWKDSYLDAARAAIAKAKGTAPAPERYTSITKGGSYEKLGAIRGAGALKGLSGIAYRNDAGDLFVREPECFAARMKLVDGVAQ